ncbi:MAG: FtsQ-type POTRA domain-containing protein [Clostridia bacterium]|nr:FtsQ-type POTRA domain-containing protein [Clostridia bacterium]
MQNPMDEMNMQPQRQPEEKAATESYGFAPRPSRRGLYTVLAVIALLTVAAVFVRGNWLRIKNVEVTGLITYTRERVLEQAKITGKSTYFNLNENSIRRNIEGDRYLRYIGMEKIWPNGLILHVQERRPQGNVLFMGVQYVISPDGMVLESSNAIHLDNGCIKVTGLELRDIRYGAPLVCQDEAQRETMEQLFEELEIQGFLDQIAELNLSSLDSIYLVTLDGYTANIGSAEEMRAKVGTVRAVVAELRRRDQQGGMIEATVPGQASYRPVQ